jgi:hypothetical protein
MWKMERAGKVPTVVEPDHMTFAPERWKIHESLSRSQRSSVDTSCHLDFGKSKSASSA